MTAYNINIEQFVNILMTLKKDGVQLINLDMIPDESNPQMNKLIIHPNENSNETKPVTQKPEAFVDLKEDQGPQDIIIKDPEDDLFDLFNKAL